MSGKLNIAVISGSTRPARKSHQVAVEISRILSEEFENTSSWIFDVLEENLPLLDNTYSSNKSPTPNLETLSVKLENSDGFIIVSPEWNGSFPGGLKNSMDYFLSPFRKKPFGIVGVSEGRLGGINAAKNLVVYAQHLKGIVSPFLLLTPKVDSLFKDGVLVDDGYKKRLDNFLKEFSWLVIKIRA